MGTDPWMKWVTRTGNISTNDTASWSWAHDSSTTDKVNVLVPAQVSRPEPKEDEPETPLEWLDRRVDEMRVAI